MILVPTELWENRTLESPPTGKETLRIMDHNYNKWTEVRLHQDPYLETEKQKREHIPIPIIETGSTKPSFKRKPERKRIISSLPVFKTKTESETDISPTHSKYIHNVFTRTVSHDPTFGFSKMILTVHLK